MKTSFYLEEKQKGESGWSKNRRIAWFCLMLLLNLGYGYLLAESIVNNEKIRSFNIIAFAIILLQTLLSYKDLLYPKNNGFNLIKIDEVKIEFILYQIGWVLNWDEVEKIQMNFGAIRFFFSSNEFRSLDQSLLKKVDIEELRKVVNNMATLKKIEIQIPTLIKDKLFNNSNEKV
jgi:hypothetical protein